MEDANTNKTNSKNANKKIKKEESHWDKRRADGHHCLPSRPKTKEK
jgi:hypothetical protein